MEHCLLRLTNKSHTQQSLLINDKTANKAPLLSSNLTKKEINQPTIKLNSITVAVSLTKIKSSNQLLQKANSLIKFTQKLSQKTLHSALYAKNSNPLIPTRQTCNPSKRSSEIQSQWHIHVRFRNSLLGTCNREREQTSTSHTSSI